MECHPEEDNHCEYKAQTDDALLSLCWRKLVNFSFVVVCVLLLCFSCKDMLVGETEGVVYGDT